MQFFTLSQYRKTCGSCRNVRQPASQFSGGWFTIPNQKAGSKFDTHGEMPDLDVFWMKDQGFCHILSEEFAEMMASYPEGFRAPEILAAGQLLRETEVTTENWSSE